MSLLNLMNISEVRKMKDFSQEFYNWLLEEKERIKKNKVIILGKYIDGKIEQMPDIEISMNESELLAINRVIKEYNEICFREED
jgi:hypothetical protein